MDVDIEVYGLSKKEVWKALPGQVQEFGQNFGVFNTTLNGQDFDVTLPRRDSKTGDGHRGFVVETDPEMSFEDAFARRDFTMNAMGWDEATGEPVDPFGGRADLDAGILRHTSSHFDEDPLRVLRGVQFSGRFSLHLAPETAELCREMAPTFHQLHTRTGSGSSSESSVLWALTFPRRCRLCTPPAGRSTSRAWPRPAASRRTCGGTPRAT
jgi:tRNA nucleotidyltransferase (CCA-adding enzyme)